jgi:hypothetical protein
MRSILDPAEATFPNLYLHRRSRYRALAKVIDMNTQPDSTLEEAARPLIARAVAVVGLAGVGVIHLLDGIGKFSETPYMGWMYVGLILASLATAAALIWRNAREAWIAALILPLSAIVGYVLTRTTGLPQATGDIGNWSEPLGLAALFTEGCLVVLSTAALVAFAPARALVRRRALVSATA